MDRNYDFLDDIIEIRSNLQALSKPFDALTTALTGEDRSGQRWDPNELRRRPRLNIVSCLNCRQRDNSYCSACIDRCPAGAITIASGAIEIADSCSGCGLCAAACSMECYVTTAFSLEHLYDRIAKAALSYECAYVLCLHALDWHPADNEIVVPCVGALPRELWFALLADFDNISVYMPIDICHRCEVSTGEEFLMEEIDVAETWAQTSVGLEVEKNNLNHEMDRNWQRKEFMQSMMRASERFFGKTNNVVNAITSVGAYIEEHTKRLRELEITLGCACGATARQERSILTQRRKLVLEALRRHPSLARFFTATRPVCVASACTRCGACVRACPLRALSLSAEGCLTADVVYCVGCEACVRACPERCLVMESFDGEELVVFDDQRGEHTLGWTEQTQAIERLKKEGKRRLNQSLDFLEKFCDKDTDE